RVSVNFSEGRGADWTNRKYVLKCHASRGGEGIRLAWRSLRALADSRFELVEVAGGVVGAERVLHAAVGVVEVATHTSDVAHSDPVAQNLELERMGKCVPFYELDHGAPPRRSLRQFLPARK